VTRLTGALRALPSPKINKKAILICAVLVVLLVLAFPPFAHAGLFPSVSDFSESIENIFKEWLKSTCEAWIALCIKFMQLLSADQILSGSFEGLLENSAGGHSIYDLVHTVWQTTVVPLGSSILALCLLVQLIKISQRIDGSSTLPTIKEFILLAVYYVVFSYLISHSFEICEAIYNELNNITSAISGGSTSAIGTVDLGDSSEMTIGCLMIMFVIAGLCTAVGLVGWVIAIAVSYARAIQLYIMATFSPIPLSLLAFDETRQMGINFLKNFVSVCLAGAIIVLLLVLFPLLSSTLDFNASADGLDIFFAVLTGDAVVPDNLFSLLPFQLIKLIGLWILLIFGLFKSGQWARDVLGG
jgi:hypothetical protein